MPSVTQLVVDHYRRHARDLPFRRTRDGYAIWVCEIMAQQTRLSVVIPYWERWLQRFPTVAALAAAPLDDVLASWSGLGYYARARSLHRAAQVVMREHGGRLPSTAAELEKLPGIGPYTAGAIASIAFGEAAPVVDGNVARIFARLYGIEEDVLAPASRKKMWDLALGLVPARAASEFNQGLMDIGATICTPRSPRCGPCPLRSICVARRDGRQAELPVLAKKGATPRIEIRAGLVTRGGRWLLFRRRPDGLFGGLWELPDLDALGVPAAAKKPLAEHTHQLTHRTIRYRVYPARLASAAHPPPPYDAARWFAPTALASLAISSATAALAKRLTENGPWQTASAQSSSSRRDSSRSSRG